MPSVALQYAFSSYNLLSLKDPRAIVLEHEHRDGVSPVTIL